MITDKFSAYAIIYGEKGSFDKYKTSATASKSAAKTGASPKTGEALPIAVPVCAVSVILALGTGICVFRKKEF